MNEAPAASTPAAARGRRTAGFLVVCLLTTGLALGAIDEEQQRAMLDLVVNEVARGQIVAIVRAGDVLLPTASLEGAGLVNLPGHRERIDGQDWVSLASLAPGVTFALDERALTLRLTAAVQYLGTTTRLDFRNLDRPLFERRRDASGFVNYGVNWRHDAGYSGSAEAGLNLRGALAATTLAYTQSEGVVRGLSTITFDQVGSLRRVVLGDSIVGGTPLGGTAFLGGLRVASEYSLDPYFLRYPALGLSGVVTSPSSVDVYVDNRLVRSQQVAPGRFELANLPVPVGSSRTRLVIRDAFGREQQFTRPFYLSSATLARGLHDYEYGVGLVRSAMGRTSWDYGRMALSARHRYGFTNFLTAGARLEAHGDLLSGGPSINARFPFGEVELAAAASRAGGLAGRAIDAGYSYTGRVLMGGVTIRASQTGYRTLSTRDDDDSPTREVTAFVAANIAGRANLSVQQSNGEGRLSGPTRRTSIYGTVRVLEGASLFFSASRDLLRGERNRQFSVGLTLMVGARTSVNASIVNAGDGVGAALEAQRGLPVGTGYAYRLRAAGGSGEGSGGRLSYQTTFGRYEVEQEQLNGQMTSSLSLSGGLVGIGGRVLPTRPVDQGFALVRVPGVEGVRTYLSNQEVGRTDRRGDLLIPNLLPYYANRLRIADEDVPLDRVIEAVERRIAPPLRGGALVVFEAARAGGVAGRVELDVAGQTIVPAFGEIAVTSGAKQTSSPIGRDGEYYLAGLQPGDHDAVISFRGQACGLTLRVPPSSEPVVDLGTKRCVTRGPR